MTHAVELDASHLQAGSFTYSRQAERVDIALTLREPNGDQPNEVAIFFGRLPERAPEADGSLRTQNEKLANDLNAERARTRKLQDAVTKLKKDQQLKRLENQSPDRK